MQFRFLHSTKTKSFLIRFAAIVLFGLAATLPAMAAGSPWDNALNALGGFFTGTFARVSSLIAVVFGGWQLMHGEPGSKRAVAGVIAGIGAALLAGNVIAWLFGV